jgi:hypothetical protein
VPTAAELKSHLRHVKAGGGPEAHFNAAVTVLHEHHSDVRFHGRDQRADEARVAALFLHTQVLAHLTSDGGVNNTIFEL